MTAPVKGSMDRIAAATGKPVLLGTITATTTKNNSDTAVPFNTTGDLLAEKMLMLQPDTACYVWTGTTTGAAATTSHIYLDAREKYYLSMGADGYVACVAVSGTTVLRVFEMT